MFSVPFVIFSDHLKPLVSSRAFSTANATLFGGVLFLFFLIQSFRAEKSVLAFIQGALTYVAIFLVQRIFNLTQVLELVWIGMISGIVFLHSACVRIEVIRNSNYRKEKIFRIASLFFLISIISWFSFREGNFNLVFASIALFLLGIELFHAEVLAGIYYATFVKSWRKKGLPPLGFSQFTKAAISFIIFLVSSQIFTILSFIPWIKRKSREKVLSNYAGFFLKTNLNVRCKVCNQSHETFEKPAMIISNHQSFLDIPLIISLSPKIIMLTTDWIKKSVFAGILGKYSGFLSVSESFEENIRILREKVKEGYSVMVFPEGKRSMERRVGRFHKGAFMIAEMLNLDILPIVINTSGSCITPGGLYYKTGSVDLHILDRCILSNSDIRDESKRFRSLISEHYNKLIESQEAIKKMVSTVYPYYRLSESGYRHNALTLSTGLTELIPEIKARASNNKLTLLTADGGFLGNIFALEPSIDINTEYHYCEDSFAVANQVKPYFSKQNISLAEANFEINDGWLILNTVNHSERILNSGLKIRAGENAKGIIVFGLGEKQVFQVAENISKIASCNFSIINSGLSKGMVVLYLINAKANVDTLK